MMLRDKALRANTISLKRPTSWTKGDGESLRPAEVEGLRQRLAELETSESERKRVEEALIASEARFRTMIEENAGGITIVDGEGIVCFANPAAEVLFDRKKEELLGTLFDFPVVAGGTSEITIFREGRKTAIAEMHVVKTEWENQLAYLVSIYDITERKRSEEQLRGQALVFENIQDSIIVTDLEGNIIRWNPAAERMFGYHKTEVFSKNLGILTTKVVKGKLRDGRWSGEMNFIRKDGTEGICETTVIPLRDEQNNITAVFGVSHDITERKQAEKRLQKERDKAKTYLDIAGVMFIALDNKGKVTLVNKKGCEILGCEEKEIFGKNWFDNFLPKRITKEVKTVFNKLIRNNVAFIEYYENPVVTKNGGEKIIAWHNTVLKDNDGNIIGSLSSGEDITNRKQSEEELQRSYYKLRETLIATVNTLASTVEMRDPYTAGHQRRVTILACAMAEEMGLTEAQFDGLRMAGLVHDIGKFSVPVEILNKPGRISETEFNIIKVHPQAGYDILKEIEFPWPVAQIVLQHHERLDGSGYPQGLKDGGIMLEAKILAVADVVEAMASHRPYRPALGIEVALEEITKNRGLLYDPEVVDCCIRLFTEKGFTLE
jgi:PAS domain S-box-containing protein/putative nucleotidyltransferase with HDIG domain